MLERRFFFYAALVFASLVAFGKLSTPSPVSAAPDPCPGGNLAPGGGEDIVLSAPCSAGVGTFHYGNVNIVNGGSLTFQDQAIDFWSKNILVENGGSLVAGSPGAPIGSAGGAVTIHLYGADQGPGGTGVACQTDASCGIPAAIWSSNGASKVCLPPDAPDTPPEQCRVYDYFYTYEPLAADGGAPDRYFGYKVLGVSFGGTLQLYGKKGASYGNLDSSSSGTSWVRLAQTVKAGESTLTLDREVDWEAGDWIVLTTTDYLPGHSERLEIEQIAADRKTLTLKQPVKYVHNGEAFPLSSLPDRLKLAGATAETRAAVGLLTRSIRIVSAGDSFDPAKADCDYDCFPPADQLVPSTEQPGQQHPYYFGGHTVIRQGAKDVKIQGVEFYQLGQGGRIGHYPVHFHHARQTPQDTLVQDNSIHDSMTRWITLHGAQRVTLARNVGYLSIGHGFYLEDGTETDNKLHSNLGVLARAAVDNVQNPRKVPGILSAASIPGGLTSPFFAYQSDVVRPSVFWMMNGWNDFEYNMAAGATACGACYWPVLGSISGHSRHMTWESYASIQAGLARGGTAPIKKFKGNFCSSAMNSFNSTPDSAVCHGVEDGSLRLNAVPNPLAPAPNTDKSQESYYPIVSQTLPAYTRCDDADCSAVPVCSASNRQACMVTVLDQYTSSFHWAETNFSAIWLRPRWFLMLKSVLTDVQNAGLTFVTGGDYTHSSVIPGNWMLARQNVFIGHAQNAADPATQTVLNPFVSDAGPFNPLQTPDGKLKGLKCDNTDINYCLSVDEGVAMPLSNFGMNQRFFNIYDGPSLQDSNAFLNIHKSTIADCPFPNVNQQCNDSGWMYGKVLGMPGDPATGKGYLPNAAIAWKQSNGFYYPPAFHSTNLFFEGVDIRHFVIEPLFAAETPGSWFKTNVQEVKNRYATWNPAAFDNFTAIDRQTILNDDDGSLTGLKTTVSVNEDPFFNAPLEVLECESDATAKTSPYEHVTTVVYPGCGTGCDQSQWNANCTSGCYGVPLYRQYLNPQENPPATNTTKIRMMGPAIGGRINLTANHGKYYIATTDGPASQQNAALKNIFQANQSYYVFLVYAQPTTRQTYQLYVGANHPDFQNSNVQAVSVDLSTLALQFQDLSWPWDPPSYDPATGILSVTMDMSAFADNYALAKQDACQPKSFCEWKNDACQCSATLQADDPDLYNECIQVLGEDVKHDICSWSVRDIDCPAFMENGVLKTRCIGFRVTLPGDFVADDVDRRPMPECFPDNADWNLPWVPAAADLAGSCAGQSLPSAQFCGGLVGNPPPPGTKALADRDRDGIHDDYDNCPDHHNPAQTETDGDGLGDACDGDDDNDGQLDHLDACPFDADGTCRATSVKSGGCGLAAGGAAPPLSPAWAFWMVLVLTAGGTLRSQRGGRF